MGISYKIEKNIAVLTNGGSFSYHDVEKTLLALTRDQDYRSGMRILFIDRGSEYNPPKHEPERLQVCSVRLFPESQIKSLLW